MERAHDPQSYQNNEVGVPRRSTNSHRKEYKSQFQTLGTEVTISQGVDHLQGSYPQTSNWLERLPAGSITTWEDLTTRFLDQFFSLIRTAKLHNDILMFQQHHGESLSEAWTCFKDLLQKVPHHGIEFWLQFQIFYDHVNPVTRRTIDQSAGGKLRDQNAKESMALLEDIALYENESWNDPRDFAKPVKAISLPQDVSTTSDRCLIELENQVQRLMEAHIAPMQPTQVKNITSSCEICSGPHDTQYCMENPEQAFVEYTSLRTDEAGGNWYTFKPEQNNYGDTYNCSWKSHQNLRNDEEIEWLNVEELLDLVDTSEESVYESLIKEMPKCSLNYDFRIKKGDPRRYEYRGRNFVGLGRDMHVFVGNMSYIMDYIILENIVANIDPSLSHVVFGRPFVEIACLVINRKHSLMTFKDEIKEVTFKTPYKDPERSELSSEGYDLLSSRIILSEDDYDRGCRKPSDLEDGFYRDTTKLGPKYLTGMDDEGEVT
ncbi:MAK10-like protein [Tanacetum coccineum]